MTNFLYIVKSFLVQIVNKKANQKFMKHNNYTLNKKSGCKKNA